MSQPKYATLHVRMTLEQHRFISSLFRGSRGSLSRVVRRLLWRHATIAEGLLFYVQEQQGGNTPRRSKKRKQKEKK